MRAPRRRGPTLTLRNGLLALAGVALCLVFAKFYILDALQTPPLTPPGPGTTAAAPTKGDGLDTLPGRAAGESVSRADEIKNDVARKKEERKAKENEFRLTMEKKVRDEFANNELKPIDRTNLTRPFPLPYLFIHIPKTAGTTMGRFFGRKYNTPGKDSKFARLWSHPYEEELPKMNTKNVVLGHFRYGLHFYIDRPATYMTMLRDPVERTVSQYYYQRKTRKDPGYQLAKNNNLKDWIQLQPAADNEQTRVLSGIRSESVPSQASFELAMYHLEHMSFVGLTERLDETLIMLETLANLEKTQYIPVVNKGSGEKAKVSDIDPEVIRLIKEHNKFDQQLYDRALQIFEEQIVGMGSRFKTRLTAYKEEMKSKTAQTMQADNNKGLMGKLEKVENPNNVGRPTPKPVPPTPQRRLEQTTSDVNGDSQEVRAVMLGGALNRLVPPAPELDNDDGQTYRRAGEDEAEGGEGRPLTAADGNSEGELNPPHIPGRPRLGSPVRKQLPQEDPARKVRRGMGADREEAELERIVGRRR